MLRFPLFVSLILHIAVMILFGVIAGIVVTCFGIRHFAWPGFLTGFGMVSLCGIVSIIVTYWMRKRYGHGISEVLLGTLCRFAILASVVVIVILTQPKSFTLYMLCFSVVFYLGQLPVTVWLTIPVYESRSKKQLNQSINGE